MFSVENLYYILYVHLFKRINADIEYFSEFGSVDITDLKRNFFPEELYINSHTGVLFHDQEPVKTYNLDQRFRQSGLQSNIVLVTSEKSKLVKDYCKQNNWHHMYYFFHGLASLFWFKDIYYFPNLPPNFKNKFISFNRLCTKDRSYRLLFISQLITRNIFRNGKVSLQLIQNQKNVIKKEIFSSDCRLSKNAKIQIFNVLGKQQDNFIIDKKNVLGSASADLGPHEHRLWQSCFLHVVSETVFFDEKLHLTEKVFKPIVSRRPFILLGAYKNLEYLKSYGFKTFDKWIDESYDSEPDNEKRLMMTCDQVEKIANLPESKIEAMYLDMKEVLDYNFQHFYTDFKKIVVDELVDNFEGYMRWHNNGRLNTDIYDIESLNLPEVKRLLLQ